MRLHLDGVLQFHRTLQSHFYENREGYSQNIIPERDLPSSLKERSWFHREIGARLAAPIQSLIILVDMIITQTLRGIVLTVGGILTLDLKKVVYGLNDLVSVTIQILILPFLGGMAFIRPKTAEKITNFLVKDTDYTPAAFSHHKTYSNAVVDFALRLISIPLAPLRVALRGSLFLLSGHFTKTLQAVASIVNQLFLHLIYFIQLFTEGEKLHTTLLTFNPREYEEIDRKMLGCTKT